MDIKEYLKSAGVKFKMHEHPPAYTAQEMAAEEHISGKITAKAVLVRAGKGFALCVLPANCKLDMSKATKALGAGKVKLADESNLAELFPDVEVGAEPPFGNLYDLPTVVDQQLAAREEIAFAGGTHRHTIRMAYADFARLAKPKVADLAVHL